MSSVITPPRPICAAHYGFGESSTFEMTFRYMPSPTDGDVVLGEVHAMIPGGDMDFAYAAGFGQVQILVRLTKPWVRPAFSAVSPASSRATGSNNAESQDL